MGHEHIERFLDDHLVCDNFGSSDFYELTLTEQLCGVSVIEVNDVAGNKCCRVYGLHDWCVSLSRILSR